MQIMLNKKFRCSLADAYEQVAYWPKPKWMRWKTFEQKRNKITELENKYWPMAIAQMDRNFSMLK
jgi:hypothetical protein